MTFKNYTFVACTWGRRQGQYVVNDVLLLKEILASLEHKATIRTYLL